jgi:hypothetical protein
MAAAAAAATAARRRKEKESEQEKTRARRPSLLRRRTTDLSADKEEAPKPVLPKQQEVYDFYASQKVQIGVAILIVCNFVFSIAEKEYDPYPDELKLYPTVWRVGTACFNFVFLIELIANFYGNVYWKNFFKGAWNIFDTLIVTLGTISLFETFLDMAILPPSLSLLRPFRAFRVFRLFKRVPSLNKIMVSLVKAVPGVANAFLIMVIIMCIYAILAVEFFSGFGSDSTYTTFQDHARRGVDATWATDENGVVWENATVSALTARGFTYGEEYYGTFARALYTLFQVLTGESWSEAVARPTMFGQSAVLSGIFYVTFIIIMQIVMLNVVVAVLLEKMVDDTPDNDDDDDKGASAAAPHCSASSSISEVRPEDIRKRAISSGSSCICSACWSCASLALCSCSCARTSCGVSSLVSLAEACPPEPLRRCALANASRNSGGPRSSSTLSSCCARSAAAWSPEAAAI